MPAVTMTKVIPKARIAIVADWMPTLIRLGTVRKCGVAMNNPMHSRIRPTSAPLLSIHRPMAFVLLEVGAGAGEDCMSFCVVVISVLLRRISCEGIIHLGYGQGHDIILGGSLCG